MVKRPVKERKNALDITQKILAIIYLGVKIFVTFVKNIHF